MPIVGTKFAREGLFRFSFEKGQGEAHSGPHLFPKAINGYWKMLKFTQALGVL